MKVVAKTHCGKVRPINEDSFLVPENDHIVLVADGMGGHQAGEVASEMAAKFIRTCAKKAAGKEISIKTAVSWVRRANKAIFKASNDDIMRSGMGTTLTFLYFMNGHAMLAHVGDSRCYLIRAGEIFQMTKDHSLVAELVSKGELTAQQAKTHPYRNIITRALGTDETVAVDAQNIDIEENDVFVLCSDGLSNYVDKSEILCVIQEKDPSQVCETMVQMALDRGGKDNITVVAAYCSLEVDA